MSEEKKSEIAFAGVQAAGNILNSISGVSYTSGARTASRVGGAIVMASAFTGPAAPIVAAIGSLISPLVKVAQGPQAYDTITGEIKKHFGVDISKETAIEYYYNLGFTTEGSSSAYRFTVQIVLTPAMLFYLWSIGGENFLQRLQADNNSKGYVYGQDWSIPLREYLETGNPIRINNLWLDIFSEKVPSSFNFNNALLPMPEAAIQAEEIKKSISTVTEKISSIPKEAFIIIGIIAAYFLFKRS